jgi:hypothetical protein
MKKRPPTKHRKFPRNDLAMCGYWSTPIQRVVKQWRKEIGEDSCRRYIISCWFAFAHPALYGKCCDISQVTIEGAEHEQYVFDLLSAYRALFNSKDKPAIWLLRWADRGGYDENGIPVPYSYDKLCQFISKLSAAPVSTASLSSSFKSAAISDALFSSAPP